MYAFAWTTLHINYLNFQDYEEDWHNTLIDDVLKFVESNLKSFSARDQIIPAAVLVSGKLSNNDTKV